MKREQVSLWAVWVRRTHECRVLVKTRDPEEARRVALANADTAEWTASEHAVAYPHEGRIDAPVWSGDLSIHPQTDLFKGDK